MSREMTVLLLLLSDQILLEYLPEKCFHILPGSSVGSRVISNGHIIFLAYPGSSRVAESM